MARDILIKLNDKIGIILAKMIAGKLFVYANSGFGKSWLLRRLIEQLFGKIQIIVIDTEGEFSTLREKFDFLLIGRGLDIEPDPKTAALMCHRLLASKVSAVIDIYELDPVDREKFVKNFTAALTNAPKNLWHPAAIIYDEAQDYAPEKPLSGEQFACAAEIVKFAKKGRKRGFMPIFATQRIADISKSVIATCTNKLIGQASHDTDMKRAAAELGFNTKEEVRAMRDLDPGEFYAFGPAISKEIQKLKIGPIQTTHPDSSKIGGRMGKMKVAPPSAKVRAALKALADLPQAAIEEATTIAEYKAKIRTLESDLRKKPLPEVDPGAIKKAIDKAVLDTERRLQKHYESTIATMRFALTNASNTLKQIEKLTNRPEVLELAKIDLKAPPVKITQASVGVRPTSPAVSTPPPVTRYKDGVDDMATDLPTGAIGKGEIAILKALAQFDGGATREHLTVLTGYKKSTRNRYIQYLQVRAFVAFSGEKIVATKEGIEALGSDYEQLPTGDALRDHLLRTLPKGEADILRVLVDNYPNAVERESITDSTQYQKSTRNRYLQYLAARELIEYTGTAVKASANLF